MMTHWFMHRFQYTATRLSELMPPPHLASPYGSSVEVMKKMKRFPRRSLMASLFLEIYFRGETTGKRHSAYT